MKNNKTRIQNIEEKLNPDEEIEGFEVVIAKTPEEAEAMRQQKKSIHTIIIGKNPRQ